MELKEKLGTNFNFKHNLGQNFITDKNLLEAIANDAKLSKKDNVLEIGAGAGTLTEVLCQKAKQVVSVEIDKSLEPVLSGLSFPNLEIKFADILKVNPQEIKSWFDGNFKVVANLPYYISSPIIFYFLENDFNLESITVMLQKEVAERLSAKQNSKDYGIVTVLLDILGNVTLTRKVPKTLFTPRPKVDSAVIRIDLVKNKYNVAYSQIAPFVKTCFAMRRKTLVNNLTKKYEKTKEEIEDILVSLNLDKNVRAENLSTSDFVNLFEKICK